MPISTRACQNFPSSLFLFAGNALKRAHKEGLSPRQLGQARIRGEPNAHEIALKHSPYVSTAKDYFLDGDHLDGKGLVKFEDSIRAAFQKAHTGGFEDMILPPMHFWGGFNNLNLIDKKRFKFHGTFSGTQDDVSKYILGRQQDLYAMAGLAPRRKPKEIRESLESIGYPLEHPAFDAEGDEQQPMGNMSLDNRGGWVFN